MPRKTRMRWWSPPVTLRAGAEARAGPGPSSVGSARAGVLGAGRGARRRVGRRGAGRVRSLRLAGGAGPGGDVAGHALQLVVGQALGLERGHAALAVRDVVERGVVVRLRVVEVRADLAAGAGVGERVAGAARQRVGERRRARVGG